MLETLDVKLILKGWEKENMENVLCWQERLLCGYGDIVWLDDTCWQVGAKCRGRTVEGHSLVSWVSEMWWHTTEKSCNLQCSKPFKSLPTWKSVGLKWWWRWGLWWYFPGWPLVISLLTVTRQLIRKSYTSTWVCFWCAELWCLGFQEESQSLLYMLDN